MHKLLYIGTLAPDSSSYARFLALDEIYETTTVEFPDINEGFNRVREKLNINKNEKQNLVIEKVKVQKFEIIWFDKPTFVTIKFIKELKTHTANTKLIAHITDDLTVSTHHFNDFIIAAKQFNFIFTCNKENIREFRYLPMFYNELGYDSKFFKLKKEKVVNKNDIVFVGHYEPAYFKQLLEISNQALPYGFNVKVFGSGWWRVKFKINKRSNLIIKSGWISRDQMIYLYQKSKVAVALYSSLNRNNMSGRVFELAAMGIPFLVKPNKVIKKNILKYLTFDEIYNDQFWKEIINSYSHVKHEFIIQANKYERHSWTSRISECIKIIDR
jgi:hypothetical protein